MIFMIYFGYAAYKAVLRPHIVIPQIKMLVSMDAVSILLYIAMGVLSWTMLPLLILAYRLKSVIAIQPIKVFEPILAGSFVDFRRIPNEIMFGICSFFVVALQAIFAQSRSQAAKEKGLSDG